MIVKNKLGYVFGGSANREWGREINDYVSDPYAFVYSWTNTYNSSVRLDIKPSEKGYALFMQDTFGPAF